MIFNGVCEMKQEQIEELRRLAEAATPGEWTVWAEKTPNKSDAIAEFAYQVENTENFSGTTWLLNANGVCPASTGCGATSEANAAYIAAANPAVILEILDSLERAEKALEAKTYQDRVKAVHGPLFDGDPTDVAERRDRFFEEAAETAQAFGMAEEDAIALVRYTFGRPVGEPKLEVGSAKLTLTSLCVEAGLDLQECAEADLEKLQRPETIARIRAKRATRHGRGPLPGLSPEGATS